MPNKMPTINEVFDKKNLQRAWRWINTCAKNTIYDIIYVQHLY